MIALPFHPSNAYHIRVFRENMADLLHQVEESAREQLGVEPPSPLSDKVKNGQFHVDQGVIAGCSGGTYQNLKRAAEILQGQSIGSDAFWLSCYPGSMPINLELTKRGYIASLMAVGASIRSCFCGPCFGAGDVPSNGGFSIRHATRNFPNREGSKPGEGQFASVALMDARSIAATAAAGGLLTGADELDVEYRTPDYKFDTSIYENRVWFGYGKADKNAELKFGPNIKDWPKMPALGDNLVLGVASVIDDEVTTTDELIPSGESSSYRSNPLGLAEFTLSRKDPAYVGRAKEIQKAQKAIEEDTCPCEAVSELKPVMDVLKEKYKDIGRDTIGIGSTIFAVKPGDGSAREQAASCQKVLGGWANIAHEYATKRYRSNLINWGMLPLLIEKGELPFTIGDYIFLPDIKKAVEDQLSEIKAYVVKNQSLKEFKLTLGELTDDERAIILKGCLINYNRR